MGGHGSRPRRRDLHRPARSPRRDPGDFRSPRLARGLGSFADDARRVCHPDRGPRGAASAGHGEPPACDRRDRGAFGHHPDPEPQPDHPVPLGRQGRHARLRGSAPDLSLSRFAQAANAAQSRVAAPHPAGDEKLFRWGGVPRRGDADPDQEHAGGRARLPRAEPAGAGLVLRAAAGAAAVQATADGGRGGPLFPDRAMLPRRGPARGPAAGVHADRHRDVVHHAGGYLRGGGRTPGGADEDGGPGRPFAPVAAHDLRRCDEPVRKRQARPSVRDGVDRSVGRLQGHGVQGVRRHSREGRRREGDQRQGIGRCSAARD